MALRVCGRGFVGFHLLMCAEVPGLREVKVPERRLQRVRALLGLVVGATLDDGGARVCVLEAGGPLVPARVSSNMW